MNWKERIVAFSMALSVGFVAFAMTSCIKAHGAVIEFPGGAHMTFRYETIPLDRGESFRQYETSVTIKRLTDVVLTTSTLSPNPKAWNGVPYAGLTNCYSRIQNVNITEEYALAFLVTPGCYLIRLSDLKVMGMVVSKALGKIGDAHELNWSKRKDEPYTIYYCGGSKLYKQNVLIGPVSELAVGDWGSPFYHTGDGDISADGRYKSVATTDKKIRAYDLFKGELLQGYGIDDTVGVDVSPDGLWVRGAAKFYKMADFINGVIGAPSFPSPGGHGAFVQAGDGHSVFVQQNAATDWLVMFDPATRVTTNLMRMPEIGGGNYGVGVHVAGDRFMTSKGWALVSVYQTGGAFAANIFWIELAAPHRIIRLCDCQHSYINNQYFTEMWASLWPSSRKASWGGNWHKTDNLEVYSAEFPPEVMALIHGSATPTPTPEPIKTPNPTPKPTATPTPTPISYHIRTSTPNLAVGISFNVTWDAQNSGTGVDLMIKHGTAYYYLGGGSGKKDTGGPVTVTVPNIPIGAAVLAVKRGSAKDDGQPVSIQ